MRKKTRAMRPHRYQANPYGRCKTCGSQENYRTHQSLLWRIFSRRLWA